jgi:hypothetical protein
LQLSPWKWQMVPLSLVLANLMWASGVMVRLKYSRYVKLLIFPAADGYCFFHSAPENMENESEQMLIHSKRIHQLFLEEGINAVGGTPSLKEINKIVRYGECFFVTSMQGQVQQDHVLSLVQFKRWDKCTFINFLGTRLGTFSKT